MFPMIVWEPALLLILGFALFATGLALGVLLGMQVPAGRSRERETDAPR